MNQSIPKNSTARPLAFLLIMSLIAGMSSTVFAGPHHKNGRHDEERGQERKFNAKRMMHHLSHLGLSEQQTTDIKALIKQGFEDAKPIREKVRSLKAEIKALAKSDNFDEAMIKEKSAAVAEAKADLLILHVNKRKQVAELLTDEQKAKMKTMREHRRFDFD